MAQTTYNGTTYTHETKIPNVGFGFSIATTAKAPAISKRVFDSLTDASGYTTNANDTACAGLILTVTGDTTSTNNGAWMVTSGGTAANGLQLTRVGGVVSVQKASTATEGYLTSYEIVVDGQPCSTKIDIPKDFFVKSASAYTVTSTMTEEIAAGVQEGHMCLDFVINTADSSETDKHTYIDLSDTLLLDASVITATPIAESNDTVAISGTTVAQQLQAIGIKIKQNVPKVSQENNSGNILHAYDDGIGITSGATWDCGEWTE